MIWLIKFVFLYLLFFDIGHAQLSSSFPLVLNYPVDTLLAKDDMTRSQRFSLNLIRLWQQKSYNDSRLNCQFYPSCSNYCAINIYQRNTVVGILMGTDRFIRCNPSAVNFYSTHSDLINPGDMPWLSDSLIIQENEKENKKYMIIGLPLSLIPGMGRVYYGHYRDGFNSFRYTTSTALGSYVLLKTGFNLLSIMAGGVSTLFWVSDFYGVYRLSTLYDQSNLGRDRGTVGMKEAPTS
jgi:putative component of membrane protein insertase Oxa1/YidC/SpoIIIJ protein YidD|tara:strand:+ start:1603 stop:2313 length:711 start_codon:yes stop_codon:yes gene_type:complete